MHRAVLEAKHRAVIRATAGSTLLAILASALMGGCQKECESPGRLDGRYVLFSNVVTHDPDPIQEGYPSRDVFYNGYSTWNLEYDPGRIGFNLLMEVTRQVEQETVTSSQPYFAAHASADTNCNVFDLEFSGTYRGPQDSTHEFSWRGTLTSIGTFLGGEWVYEADWSAVGDGAPVTGSVTSKGEIRGNLSDGEMVDTGF
jgi:hypothetical protein